MSPDPQFDLGRLIRGVLEKTDEVNPGVIARRLLPRVPGRERDRLLGDLLRDRVRQEIHAGRRGIDFAHPSLPSRRVGRSKWAVMAPFLRKPVCVGTDWKMVGDCTADDLDVVASDYARRAAENAAYEGQFRALAGMLRARGVETVADLPAGAVEALVAA